MQVNNKTENIFLFCAFYAKLQNAGFFFAIITILQLKIMVCGVFRE